VSGSSVAVGFLMRLAGDDVIPGDKTAAIVAHPDDETLGLGAQLPRMPGMTIVHVTDGAPRNLADAHRLGFETAEAYARARRRELEAAMALVGIAPDALVALGVPDQEAAFQLAPIARRLADLLADRRIDVVFTHTYEGGHPDHEATAFAVQAASELVTRRSGRGPIIVEMPFYRADVGGRARQRFLPQPEHPDLAFWLSDEQRALKERMYAAHASQKAVLDQFPIQVERFRVAPPYDFTILPPVDAFLYEDENWGLTAPQWIGLVEQARRDLAEEIR
jgi:LmbE family N-acetylglucosaminyl deacetylase